MRARGSAWWAALATLGGGLAAVGLVVALARGPDAPPPSRLAGAEASTQTPASAQVEASRRTAIVVAAERVGRSVVAISARSTQQANPYAGTIWEDFFPLLRQPRAVQSLGSGFIVSADGTILTNGHVVEGAESVRVTLMDGREFPADVVGADPRTDVAVLRIQAPDLPVAPLGSSANLLIGEWAIAIGNPFAPLLGDANPSVTVGVISALHRDVRPFPGQEQLWTDMIQTDASINPGNSGGPLVNAAGEVVGVNSFIFSRSGESIGIGFAIPIDRARRITDDIVRYGTVRLTWLGLHVEDVTPAAGSRADRPRVRISRVDPGSPAEAAGVQPGDGLVAANGRRVLSALDWEGRRRDFRVEENVQLDVERDGRVSALTLRAAPDPLSSAKPTSAPLGLSLTELTPQLRSYLDVTAERGLLVTAVEPGSPAENIGLEEGDVILAVNDRRLTSVEEAVEVLRGLPDLPRASLVWERQGRLFRWVG